jgi:hypothetical protein
VGWTRTDACNMVYCHSFPEPLAPVSCFGHLRCSFLFPPSPEARDVSHDRDATRLACDPCYNHPSSYGTCFLPAVHPAVPSYQLLSARLPGRLGRASFPGACLLRLLSYSLLSYASESLFRRLLPFPTAAPLPVGYLLFLCYL